MGYPLRFYKMRRAVFNINNIGKISFIRSSQFNSWVARVNLCVASVLMELVLLIWVVFFHPSSGDCALPTFLALPFPVLPGLLAAAGIASTFKRSPYFHLLAIFFVVIHFWGVVLGIARTWGQLRMEGDGRYAFNSIAKASADEWFLTAWGIDLMIIV